MWWLPVVSVPVLKTGVFQSKEELLALLGKSLYVSDRKIENLSRTAQRLGLDVERQLRETDTSDTMEGLYIKIEENGQVVGRLKYVRASFSQTLNQTQTHWLDRPIIPNGLAIAVEDLYGPKLPGQE